MICARFLRANSTKDSNSSYAITYVHIFLSIHYTYVTPKFCWELAVEKIIFLAAVNLNGKVNEQLFALVSVAYRLYRSAVVAIGKNDLLLIALSSTCSLVSPSSAIL